MEAWTTRDHPGEWKTWLSWLDHIAKKVSTIEGVTTSIFEPTELSNRSPVLNIYWDVAQLNITGEEVAEELEQKPNQESAIGARDQRRKDFLLILLQARCNQAMIRLLANRI